MKILIIPLMLLLLLAGCSPKTRVIREYTWIEKPVIEYVIVEKPVYIDQIIEKVKWVHVVVEREVKVTVEVPIDLREFGSVEGLREWLGDECHFILIGKNNDCDDYARWLQQQAFKDGYLINYEAILPFEYNQLFKQLRINQLHAINSAIIGNDFYYIEPQTREIVWRGALD